MGSPFRSLSAWTSAMGHSRRFRDVRVAAALPPTAVMMLQCRKRRDVPIGDILTIPGHPSGDHLNGTYVPVEEPSTASNPDMASRATSGLQTSAVSSVNVTIIIRTGIISESDNRSKVA